MARVLIIGGLLAAAFAVYAIVDCALTEGPRVRALPKPAWIAVILLVPVLGGVLWFALGRGPAVEPVRRRAPDDDPEFLRRAGARRAPAEPDWRRLEQELVDLDTDTDDDSDGRRR